MAIKTAAIIVGALSLAACAEQTVSEQSYSPPPGSNEIMRAPIEAIEGFEVIAADIVILPDAAMPPHYHPGEEYLYLIEGSVIQVEEGKPDRLLKAGDAYVIPARAVHAPRGGPEGARAVVFRVHRKGAEERILVDEEI